MNKEFIPYEQALALKGIGFDEPCFSCYYIDGTLMDSPNEDGTIYPGDNLLINHTNNYCEEGQSCSAPTYSQAFSFFRKKYGLDNAVLENRYVIEREEDLPKWYYGFKTYGESELACLVKLIEISNKIKDSSSAAPTWYN